MCRGECRVSSKRSKNGVFVSCFFLDIESILLTPKLTHCYLRIISLTLFDTYYFCDLQISHHNVTEYLFISLLYFHTNLSLSLLSFKRNMVLIQFIIIFHIFLFSGKFFWACKNKLCSRAFFYIQYIGFSYNRQSL